MPTPHIRRHRPYRPARRPSIGRRRRRDSIWTWLGPGFVAAGCCVISRADWRGCSSEVQFDPAIVSDARAADSGFTLCCKADRPLQAGGLQTLVPTGLGKVCGLAQLCVVTKCTRECADAEDRTLGPMRMESFKGRIFSPPRPIPGADAGSKIHVLVKHPAGLIPSICL